MSAVFPFPLPIFYTSPPLNYVDSYLLEITLFSLNLWWLPSAWLPDMHFVVIFLDWEGVPPQPSQTPLTELPIFIHIFLLFFASQNSLLTFPQLQRFSLLKYQIRISLEALPVLAQIKCNEVMISAHWANTNFQSKAESTFCYRKAVANNYLTCRSHVSSVLYKGTKLRKALNTHIFALENNRHPRNIKKGLFASSNYYTCWLATPGFQEGAEKKILLVCFFPSFSGKVIKEIHLWHFPVSHCLSHPAWTMKTFRLLVTSLILGQLGVHTSCWPSAACLMNQAKWTLLVLCLMWQLHKNPNTIQRSQQRSQTTRRTHSANTFLSNQIGVLLYTEIGTYLFVSRAESFTGQ